MKHVLLLAAAIVIGLSGQAFARLGQTEDQVNAFFGKQDYLIALQPFAVLKPLVSAA